MGITRLNHAVLHVADVERSIAFYGGVLGFRVTARMGAQAAFLQAPDSTNDHDLGLFEARGPGAPAGAVGLYHLAWEVPTLADLEAHRVLLEAAGALIGASDHGTTKSLYARDPDGIELEVAWVVPLALLGDDAGAVKVAPLDLAAQTARYGAHTRGGVGVSVPS